VEKASKYKKIAVMISIASFLCFFILIFTRKYDPIFNILKLVCLCNILIIAISWLVIKVVIDYKHCANIKTIMLSCFGLLLCLMVIPFASLISKPQSNLLNINRTPLEKSTLFYDKYSNLIYSSTVLYKIPEVIEIHTSEFSLELEFIEAYEGEREGRMLFIDEVNHGYGITEYIKVYIIAHLRITYDANHQILTYDLIRTSLSEVSYESKNKYISTTRRLSIANDYSSTVFSSTRKNYYFEEIVDGTYDSDEITHHEFAPDDVRTDVITSTRNIISSDYREFEISLVSTTYLYSADPYTFIINASQQIKDNSNVITYSIDNYSSHTINIESNQIIFDDHLSTYDRQEIYKKYDDLFLMQKKYEAGSNKESLIIMSTYHNIIKDDIYVEFTRNTENLIKIKDTNYGYVLEYYDSKYSTIPYGVNQDLQLAIEDSGFYYLDYFYQYLWLRNRSSFDQDIVDVIYPNLLVFTFL